MDYHPDVVWTTDAEAVDLPALSIMARSMIAARRALHGPLPSALIHDPALDLLLHSFVAKASDLSLDQDRLVAKTSVPPTTATRWIGALEQAGFLARSGPTISLSDAGVVAVVESLRAVSRSQWHLDDVDAS